VRLSLVILCAPGDDPRPRLLELASLATELEEVLLAAPTLNGLPALPHVARVASVHRARGLAGALHAALAVARSPELLAVAAARPVSLEALRRLAAAPAAGNVLLLEDAPLPGRYRRGCLGPLTRALAAGEGELAVLARVLHASRLRVRPSGGGG